MKHKFLKILPITICLLSACMFVACGNKGTAENLIEDSTENATDLELEGTLAHWKLQNDEKYFSGSLNGMDLKFYDLTGNGNTLQVDVEGKGYKMDVFSWVDGSNLTSGGKTALYFANTFANAKNVCPTEFDPEDMEYTGGTYVSGKYLETAGDAPINRELFDNGYTIEIIFRLDSNFNQNYNRYVGLFSRQGVFNKEPWFSMSIAELSDMDENGYLTKNGNFRIQLIQQGSNGSMNKEFSSYSEGEWIHYMVVSDKGQVTAYVNGELVLEPGVSYINNIGTSGFGWEVGVGRKSFEGESVLNQEYAEGGIRRLFCGAISEIRVMDHSIDIEESLYFAPIEN